MKIRTRVMTKTKMRRTKKTRRMKMRTRVITERRTRRVITKMQMRRTKKARMEDEEDEENE